VKPPFVVYEHGDIIFFDTLEAMGGYVEAIDVINNEYEFFDATGNEIIAKPIKNSDSNKTLFGLTLVNCGRVTFELNGKNDVEKLKRFLLDFAKNISINIEQEHCKNIENIINVLLKSGKVDCVK
jgi:hypothetical protein